MQYLLLAAGAIAESAPWDLRNLVAALFRLETSPAPAERASVLGALLDGLQDPARAALQRGVAVWIQRVWMDERVKVPLKRPHPSPLPEGEGVDGFTH